MRKCYLLCLLMFLMIGVRAQFPAPYCAEAFPGNGAPGGVEPITRVVFAGINNTSSATVNGTPAHQNFTSITGAAVKGQAYTIEVQGNTAGNFTHFIRVFFDWNNDGDFTDAGESFNVGTIANSTGLDGKTASTSVLIPANAVVGNIRMRVSKRFSVYPNPCNNVTPSYGQAEDYTIVVTNPDPCTDPPMPGTITTSANPACSGANFTLTSEGGSTGLGQTYQWQFSTNGTVWSDVPGATGTTLTRSQTTATYYRLVYKCGAGSSFSNELFVGTILCYCASGATNPGDTEIFNVTVEGSSNASDCNVQAPGTGSILGRYANYYPLGSFVTLTAGTTIDFNVQIDDCTPAGYKTNKGAIWIDFNQDGDFDDAGEKVFEETTLTIGPRTMQGNITIPLSALTGTTTMRVIVVEGATLNNCGTYTFGETEDYYITIIGPSICSGPSAAGNTSAFPSTVCMNQPVYLQNTGATITEGQSYQWQVSTDNVNWTDISGATSLTKVTSQSQNSWYRFRIVCIDKKDTTYSNIVQVNTPAGLSGTYTINKNITGASNLYPITRVFNSFSSAYSALKCGITGAVIFDVTAASGPYSEQVFIDGRIPGSSAVNTITFQGNGNTITHATTTSDPAVIKLKATEFFTFENFTIQPTGVSAGFGVHLTSDANNNTIEGCTINLNTSAISGFAGVVINGSDTDPIGAGVATALCDNNKIKNNTIIGGVYGITLTSTFPTGAHGNNSITGNRIRDFYERGVYVSGTYLTVIDSNYFSRPSRSSSPATVSAIYFNLQSNDALISRNRITNPYGNQLSQTSSTFNGIDFNLCSATPGNHNQVINNLIYKMNGNASISGINNNGSAQVWYAHNTISLDSLTTSFANTRGFSHTNPALGIIFYNNIVSITRGGPGAKHAIFTTGLLFACDYNNYYVSVTGGTSAIGFYSSNRTTLVQWQTATGHDKASTIANPVFVDVNNGHDGYRPGNAALDNRALYFGVERDILDQVRGGSPSMPPGTKPDMGAFEFIPPACTIPPVNGTTSITPVGSVCQFSTVRLDLNIGAFGAEQTFQWQTSTSSTGPWTNLGDPLVTPDTLITVTSTLFYRALISCSGSTVESNPVEVVVNPGMPGGVYTIDRTNPSGTTYVPGISGGNFASFNAAYSAMKSCGILGAITFDVVPLTGPYVEQLKIDSIAGASFSNTITFNGNGNTISFGATAQPSVLEKAVIKLDNTEYVTFDSLIIDARGYSFGFGFQLLNNADNNVLRRSQILTNIADDLSYVGIVISSADAGPITVGNTLSDANVFDGNTIVGGLYGITIAGGDIASQNDIQNNRVTNNRILDFGKAGVYVVGGTYNTLLEGNVISRANKTSAVPDGIYGVWVAGPNPRLTISKNRISNLLKGVPASTTTQYGIAHINADVIAGNDNVVSNNLIYGLQGEGDIYGLYNNSSNAVKYYHNTISIDNSLSTSTRTSRGFYQTGTPQAIGLDFFNNNITIRRGGSGNKHGIYLETPNSEIRSDYNNIYVAGTGSTNFFGYYTVDYVTLAAWQSNTSKDAHSFSVDPVYVDTLNGNYSAGIQTLDNKGTWVGIATDIIDQVRDPLTPDIGAYEFVPISCVEPPLAGVASVTPSAGTCLEIPITLSLTGHSSLGTLSFQWQSSPTGLAGSWMNISPVLFNPTFNTVTGVNSYYRALVTCGAGTPVASTVVQISQNNILLAGTYTIDNSLPTNWPGAPPRNFNSFNDAVAAMSCGIGGPVVFNVLPGSTSGVYNEQVLIPYIKNSSAINTITFQSANGVPASVILTNDATTAPGNYTLKLDGAKHVTFQNITIRAVNSSFGRVVEIADTASFNTLSNCIIEAPVTTLVNTNLVGVYANPVRGKGNLIKGNTIRNGVSGIYMWGAASNLLASENVIDSNTVTGTHAYGINVRFHKGAKVLRNTVNVSSPLASTGYGIYADECDSSYLIQGNKINISNAASQVYALYVTKSDSSLTEYGRISGNIITCGAGNSGNLFGIYIDSAIGHKVTNNTVSINTSSPTSYGLYVVKSSYGEYSHNSILNNSSNGTTTSVAARFQNNGFIEPARLTIKNNIFSHRGNGRAMYVATTSQAKASDYNMLHTTGSVLVQRAEPAGNFGTLAAWQKETYWDLSSIAYSPAFVSSTDLRPDITNPNVWAIHGRGIQVKGDTLDINGNYRPDSLTAGVPDLGAYEFLPTALPTVLTPVPAGSPSPGLKQSFLYGTDTVMSITWGANVPSSVSVRRFSGVVPTNPPYPAPGDSMFFYVQVETPGDGKYDADVKLFYLDPWQGSIPEQWMLGLGRYTIGNNWVVGFSSRVDASKKVISQSGLDYLNKFTGFINPYSPPIIPDRDTSNRGRRFWVAYPKNQLSNGGTNNSQQMVLYLSAEEPANVTVKINGTSWVRTYSVPAYSVVETDFLPKDGPDRAYLHTAGIHDQGISIESDVPIVAYAHYTGSASSGAAVLLPVSTWGWEYKMLGISQAYAGSYSYLTIISDNDNSVVEITPTKEVQNPGFTPNVPTQIILNRGQVFQLLAKSLSEELTGTVVKSLANSDGRCLPVAVFSGSTRTALRVDCSSGGDFMMQQNFPATAWGKRYLTAPSSASTDPTSLQKNIYRIAVRDASTIVKRNGVIMTGLINNHYYQYESTTPDYIEADKAIMVAQYLTGACTGVGDPEMIYLSPHEQGIKNVTFFRNNRQAITTNYLTLIIPEAGLSTLVLTDGATVVTPDYVYDHPQSALFGEPYKVVVKRWNSAQQQVRVESSHNFMGITYGLGNVESYGYNVGFFLKNLQAAGTFVNELSTVGNTDFTCVGSPFTFSVRLPIIPTSITYNLSNISALTPNSNVSISNPIPSSTSVIGRDTYYSFKLSGTYKFTSPGIYRLPVTYQSPEVEGCNNTKTDTLYIQVVPAPKTNFAINFTGCEDEQAQFTGEVIADNGAPLSSYQWTFHDGSTSNGSTASFNYPTPGTYNVNLYTVTVEGCIGDSTKQVVVNERPDVPVVDDITVCPGTEALFTVQTPVAGATYNWYTSASGGVPIVTGGNYTVNPNGTSLRVQNVTMLTEFYVETVSAAGCTSISRKRVQVNIQAPLTKPIATVTNRGVGTITFGWSAITGAAGYEVSINGGGFIIPSSGSTGLSHTVTGLASLDSVNFVVKALGAQSCQDIVSDYITGCENSSAVIANSPIQICANETATFNIQNPVATITYNWHDALTGGSLLHSGNSYTTALITTNRDYFVEQVSVTGCVGSPRTLARVEVRTPLAQTNLTVAPADVSATAITFRWTSVPGGGSYLVSLDGTTWIPPSSGSTGLLHTVTGLQPGQQVCLRVRAIGVITCQTSETAAVCAITRPDDIFIPNTFTPNGDGKNDVLMVYGWAIQNVQFMVFNQWGEKLHEVNTNVQDATGGFIIWDGRYKGKVQPVGVYVFSAKITLKDGSIIQKSGALNIIR